jgi:hypothetical protein
MSDRISDVCYTEFNVETGHYVTMVLNLGCVQSALLIIYSVSLIFVNIALIFHPTLRQFFNQFQNMRL